MSPRFDASLEKIRSYWQARATSATTHRERIDHSQRSQQIRYDSFLSRHDLSGQSILDVGCGLADLEEELRRRAIACEYAGLDIAPEMVRLCRLRFPDAQFHVGELPQWNPGRRFHYVVSFGIHSNVQTDDGFELMREITRRQFELCQVAAHLTLLTDRHQGFGPGIQSWNAEAILKMALEISPYVSLRHDYLPHDFSVTLYKEPAADRLRAASADH